MSSEFDSLKENQGASKSQHGGKRPGAGRPKHSKNPETIEREEALKQFKDRVAKSVEKIFNSQLDLAVGEKYLFVIRTTGKGAKQRRETSIVEDPETIRQYLDGELHNTNEEYFFMTTKPANNQALESLMSRAFGRPKESVDLNHKGDGLFGNTEFTIKVVKEDE